MRHKLQILSVFVFLAVVVTPVAADEKSVQTMSGILVKLNHFPSDAEKKALQQIADDKTATQHERVVAQALINVKHKVSADDQTKLEALLKDKSAPESLKTLATIIVNLNHAPSDADKEKLKKLEKPSS